MQGQGIFEVAPEKNSGENCDLKMSEIFEYIRLFNCIGQLTTQNHVFLESIQEIVPRCCQPPARAEF